MLRHFLAVTLACLVPVAVVAQEQKTEQAGLKGYFIQGGFAEGQTEPGTSLRYDGVDVPVGPDGDFLIGFHRDEAAETTLEFKAPDGTRQRVVIDITLREYAVQRIDGLPQNTVSPPQDVLDRIGADAASVREARAQITMDRGFDSGWIWPVIGRISGVYGSQRILNGEPRQPHYGIDIAAPAGTPVKAPGDGVVSLVAPDMYFSGGTLMIDHGRGLASTFLHLQSIDVVLGQSVKQGQVIATVGSTGRSTGPHLDWRINWFNKRLDAGLFVGPMPNAD